jgi:SAM-dependent methyltransferase
MSQLDPQLQRAYWEQAGKCTYCRQMYRSDLVADHIRSRSWKLALDFGIELGLTPQACVLDLGCGDGAFTNKVLASYFDAVDGFDFAEAGISRARAEAPKPQVRFEVCDLTRADFKNFRRYDGAFLIGILHHVKNASPRIVRALRQITSRVVVLEPNGNNIMRKVLERTQAYRDAGEDSFRTGEIFTIFDSAGFRRVLWRRLSLFPNFTPKPIFETLRPLEAVVESTPVLRGLCTANLFGFVADE